MSESSSIRTHAPMHTVERHFQDFRRWAGHDLDAVVAQYRAEAAALGEDPSRVVLSQRGVLRYLEGQSAQAGRVGVVRRASELQGWLAYRSTKTILVIDERLAEELRVANRPYTLTTAEISPPVNGAVLRLPLSGDEMPTDFVVFYDYGIAGEMLLRILRLCGGVLAPCGTLRLEETRREAMLALRVEDESSLRTRSERENDLDLAKYLERELPGYREAAIGREQIMRHVLDVLRYLNGGHQVARRVLRAVMNRRRACTRSPERDDRRSPREMLVGSATVSLVQTRPRGAAVHSVADTETRMKPHARRAHQRVFWIGKGRKIAKVRLVRSTVVHGGPEGSRSGTRTRRRSADRA